jgi:glycosyltransferase involved in cell wall biosynthesis
VLELITIKPVVYGGLCAKLLGLKHVVFYMSGLGSQFMSKTMFGRFKRRIILNCYKFLMSSGLKRVIVENNDDYFLFLERLNVRANRLFKIGGVGVDLHQFSPQKRVRKEQVNIGMVSRLLHDKGVMEFYQSACALSGVHDSVQFHLAGEIDPSNPASLTEVELRKMSDSSVIKLHGHIDEIDSFLSSIEIFVLPSYREGFPRAIMEASAMGLPVVACDVTGCRDAVVLNHTGLLCVAMDSAGLTGAIERLILDKDLRRRLGNEGRQYALCNFDEEIISKAHLNILEGTAIE